MTRVIDPVSFDDVARALDLHSRAYETLLWLSNVAFARPHMLTEKTAEVLRDANTCRQWVAEHGGDIPARLRPAPQDAESFSLLFSSFFQTSFRVERRQLCGEPPYYVIAANKDEARGKDKLGVRKVPRALEKKRKSEAAGLEYRALLLLHDGPDDEAFWSVYSDVMKDQALHKELLIWTYGYELVRRSRGDAHGPAVHVIWKQIGKDTRTRLTAQRVWEARARLLSALGVENQ